MNNYTLIELTIILISAVVVGGLAQYVHQSYPQFFTKIITNLKMIHIVNALIGSVIGLLLIGVKGLIIGAVLGLVATWLMFLYVLFCFAVIGCILEL